MIPSFGGWSADQGGTEIADSCKDVNAIAAAYETVITPYNVTRLDMDIEGRSLTNAGRHRPAQQGDEDRPGLGRRARTAAPDQLHAADVATGLERLGVADAPERGRERRARRRRATSWRSTTTTA